MNPHTRNSAIVGEIAKVAAALINDRHALIEVLTQARTIQRRVREQAEVKKASAA